MTIGLALDVLIICMLAATTGYGAVLNRRLGRLRAGQGEFAALIGSFNESARRAEACVHRLRAVGAEGGRAIDDRIEAAQALRDELRYLIERGSRLGESLGAPVAARQAAPRPRVDAADMTAAGSVVESELLESLRAARKR